MTERLLLLNLRGDFDVKLPVALCQAGYRISSVVFDIEDFGLSIYRLVPDISVVYVDTISRATLSKLAIMTQSCRHPIVVLCDQGDVGLIRAASEVGVSLFVVDSFSPVQVQSLIEVAQLHFRDQDALQKELSEARETLENSRVIHLAKCRLMENQGLSEDDAYHHLRRMAMTKSQRIGDTARLVLGGKA